MDPKIGEFVKAWRERMAARRRRRAEREEAARRAAYRCAGTLAGAGARRVWLFGSLARPGSFHEGSDIDLAAEGIADDSYLGVLDRMCRETGFEVSLVRVEHAPESLRRVILAEGERLHGR